jgi:arginine utilization protein RocB
MASDSARQIQGLLLELVGVQSDTGTPHELAMAKKLLALLRGHGYFARHPDQCGAFEDRDLLHRPVVWGLRRGRSSRTVILEGHYDTVEIDCYGLLKPYALTPALLKQHMKPEDPQVGEDLDDEAWGFGRGMADMKAGLAINLHTLLSLEDPDVSILFLAVPDEENMSSGALQAIGLLGRLQEQFGLDYRLLILTEPQIHGKEDLRTIRINRGGIGKMLPVVLAKGVLTHSAAILKGLNSAFMLAEIVRSIELNTSLSSSDQGVVSPPPAVQFMRDLKTTYDVTVPEYSAACFNVMFLRTRPPMALLEDLERICADALASVLHRHQEAHRIMAGQGGADEDEPRAFRPTVLTLARLEQQLQARSETFPEFKRETTHRLGEKVRAGELNLPTASIQYMRAMVERAGIPGPAVVLGVAPPYYPSVQADALGKDFAPCLDGLDAFMRTRYATGVEFVPYVAGMTDLSYTSSTDPVAERRFLDNLALAPEVYDVPVERIARLNIPAVTFGPAGRDIHKPGERVYLPDVTRRIPDLVARIIAQA